MPLDIGPLASALSLLDDVERKWTELIGAESRSLAAQRVREDAQILALEQIATAMRGEHPLADYAAVRSLAPSLQCVRLRQLVENESLRMRQELADALDSGGSGHARVQAAVACLEKHNMAPFVELVFIDRRNWKGEPTLDLWIARALEQRKFLSSLTMSPASRVAGIFDNAALFSAKCPQCMEAFGSSSPAQRALMVKSIKERLVQLQSVLGASSPAFQLWRSLADDLAEELKKDLELAVSQAGPLRWRVDRFDPAAIAAFSMCVDSSPPAKVLKLLFDRIDAHEGLYESLLACNTLDLILSKLDDNAEGRTQAVQLFGKKKNELVRFIVKALESEAAPSQWVKDVGSHLVLANPVLRSEIRLSVSRELRKGLVSPSRLNDSFEDVSGLLSGLFDL